MARSRLTPVLDPVTPIKHALIIFELLCLAS